MLVGQEAAVDESDSGAAGQCHLHAVVGGVFEHDVERNVGSRQQLSGDGTKEAPMSERDERDPLEVREVA